MKEFILSAPKFGFILATRMALAFGAALLVSRKINERQRSRVGKTLVTMGGLTTVPAAILVRRNRRR